MELPHAWRRWQETLINALVLIRPAPDRNAGEWADAERREPSYLGRGGRWETSVTPYWWEPLRATNDARTRQVTVVASSQSGKTANVILNLIGHRFSDGPRMPMLIVLPTQKLAKSMSGVRVQKMIESTPTLNALHAKGKKDSMYEKWIGGVPLIFAWSGSNTEIASHPSGYALVDEVDRMKSDAQEGDVLARVRVRLMTFIRSLLVVCSSPTIQDSSRIQDEFEAGSMEVAEWPCLHCGEYHRPLSTYLRFPPGSTPAEAARKYAYVCPHCGAEHYDKDKRAMTDRHRYRQYRRNDEGQYEPHPEPPEIDPYHRSFLISGLLATWEKSSFRNLARELRGAQQSQDPAEHQAVLNTFFAEWWTVRGERPPLEEVQLARLPYQKGQIPHGVQRITIGVDVQQDRLVWAKCGFGAEAAPMQCWVLDYGEIWGNTAFDDAWLELQRMARELQGTTGRTVNLMLIDSGWKPGSNFVRPEHRIYSFCRREGARAFPCKGYRTRPAPVSTNLVDVQEHGKSVKNGVRLFRVDTTFFKTMIYSRLAPQQDVGARAFHLPIDVSDDFMRQLTAEELVMREGGEPFYFCPRHRPNHYGDAVIYAFAGAYSLEMARRLVPLKGPAPDVEDMASDLAAKQAQRPAQPLPSAYPKRGFQRRSL